MAPTIQVLTLDDQPLFHHGVASMLAGFDDIAVAGAAYSAEEALSLAQRLELQVALVELHALGEEWALGLRRLLAVAPGLRLLILTQEFDARTVITALQLGAVGYLLKTVQPVALAQAIRTAATGHLAFCAEAMQVVVDQERERVTPIETLTQREREIWLYLVKGLSNGEIGERLCISTATVKFHSRNLFAKLNVASRARAIAMAYQHRLVPLIVAGAPGEGPDYRPAPVAGRRVAG